MSSSQKKRKSDVHANVENNGLHPSKKDKPWYHVEAAAENEATMQPSENGKERRKSFLGGLLKKMRSSSTLKDKNRTMSSSKISLASNVDMKSIASEVSDTSFLSETSDGYNLPIQFHNNTDLLKFVENVEREPSVSTSNWDESSISSTSNPHGSVASLCTPHRGSDFHRGQLRSSARSMPGESDLFNGLCNSVVRRAASTVSDSSTSPRGFLRRKSIRIVQKLGGSMADLPEDRDLNTSFAPLTEVDDETDSPKQMLTPVGNPATSKIYPQSENRRSSWLNRSKSRVFGSNKRAEQTFSYGEADHDSSLSALTPVGGEMSVTLRGSTPSSSSLQKRVSSALRKGFGLRGSSTNMGCSGTPLGGGIIKRNKTNYVKDRPTGLVVRDRRCSDVSSMISSHALQSAAQDLANEAELREARLFLAHTRVADVPVLQALEAETESGGIDAVVVDLLINGKPASDTSAAIVEGEAGDTIHNNIMRDSSRQSEIVLQGDGKPSIVYTTIEYSHDLARRVRNGIGSGLRLAFASDNVRNVLLYPMFCRTPEEWNHGKDCIDQLLMTVMKSLGWNTAPDKIGNVIIAGISSENVALLKERYQMFVDTQVTPKIFAAESSVEDVAASVTKEVPEEKTVDDVIGAVEHGTLV